MTKQETFDLVVAHLLTQMAVSEGGGNTGCMYRGPNGLKCAVGALIPDAMYAQWLEGQGVGTTNGEGVRIVLRELGHDVRLCASLQEIHDQAPPASWKEELEHLAEVEGLAFNPPQVAP